jgi:hypothetical protein
MGVGALRIRGVVRREGEPLEGAYITLSQGETFIAERRTGPDGVYEFHATPGEWILVCRAAGGDEHKQVVQGEPGELALDFEL